MFRFLSLLLLAFSLATPFTATTAVPALAPPATQLDVQHATTHLLTIYDLFDGKSFNSPIGHCSATAVGPHALLTAQHCFSNSNVAMLDSDNEPTHIIAAFIDGNDHVIYLTDRTFTSWSPISERTLVENEHVHLWGNPGHNTDVFREGYFLKMDPIAEDDPTLFQSFILPIYPGDSGSGIFDSTGHIIAVVSLAGKSADNYDLPLTFSEATLHLATTL